MPRHFVLPHILHSRAPDAGHIGFPEFSAHVLRKWQYWHPLRKAHELVTASVIVLNEDVNIVWRPEKLVVVIPAAHSKRISSAFAGVCHALELDWNRIRQIEVRVR